LLKQIRNIGIFIFLILSTVIQAQIKVNQHKIDIRFDKNTKHLFLKQNTKIVNKTTHQIDTIYFYNWLNAYRNKKTALAKRFIENYDLNFHFTRKKNRGFTKIEKIIAHQQVLTYHYVNKNEDIIAIVLPKSLKASDSIQIYFNYEIQLPNKKFTGYGIDKNNNISLKHFYFSPLPYSSKKYAHKDLDDMPELRSDFIIKLNNLPSNKNLISNLKLTDNHLIGKDKNIEIILTDKVYDTYTINDLKLHVFSHQKDISLVDKHLFLSKIVNYLTENLGTYPQNSIVISQADLKRNKLYGPDLLPHIINPFPKKILWEMEMLHQIASKYVDNIQVDKRKYPWIPLGIAAYETYKYTEQFYPNLKLIGKLSRYKLLKYYYASEVKMNEKYPWLYLYMARMNKDQALQSSLDSLSNFNRTVSMPYKSALGMLMLENAFKKNIFKNKLYSFYRFSLQNQINNQSFFKQFEISKYPWFKTYVETRTKYDYKLYSVTQKNDSIYAHIKNKHQYSIPFEVFITHKDSIVYKQYFSPLKKDTILRFSYIKKADMLGINYFNRYPELQINNNYKSINSKFIFKKPLQIRVYQDFENPLREQIFVNPYFEYNYYDGILLGAQIYNEKILHNNFFYSFSPSYGTKSKELAGSFSINYSQYFENIKPYAIKYSFNGRYYHYDHNLTYKRFNPNITVKFRNKYLRKRSGSNIKMQFMYVDKEVFDFKSEEDQYAVLNISYAGFKVNVINDFYTSTDMQFSKNFGKISSMFRYRFLSNKNRQWDFRLYFGYFLYNHTGSDYFSFALDRPTDYLFQHNYYGRSETSGFFHQQFIWAEGGFKTFFDDQYANQFIISNNLNIGIWKWFNIYGDLALKKNRNESIHFYYDSGVRINLVQDYFELFFPVYSSLGNELKQPEYYKHVRMVYTLNINKLFRMVRRGWY